MRALPRCRLKVPLFGRIVPSESLISYLPSKIEIKMKKEEEGSNWPHLEPTAPQDKAAAPAPAPKPLVGAG